MDMRKLAELPVEARVTALELLVQQLLTRLNVAGLLSDHDATAIAVAARADAQDDTAFDGQEQLVHWHHASQAIDALAVGFLPN